MILTGKNGKEYNVEYAYAPTRDGRCVIQLLDEMTFPDAASEFTGVENFHLSDPASGEMDFSGYTEIVSMRRNNTGINIQLIQPEGA